MEACINFAEQHKLISQEEIEMGKKMMELGKAGGPGGCRGMVQCDAYCDNIDNIEECVTFGEKHGMIPPEELKEVKQMLKAVKKGIKPPPCKSKSECDSYCSNPDHMEECLKFSEAAGMIPKEEIKEARMMLKALKKGLKPLPCNSKQECDVYCHEPENVTECIDFAEAAGFMTKEDAEMSRKTGGKGPGGCKGDQECRDFCDNPDHRMECMKFSLEYGLMNEEDAMQTKKMIEAGVTGGPGNCNSDEECRAFCGNPDNMETCMEFSVKMGDMTKEEKDEAMRQTRERREGRFDGGFDGCGSEEECNDFCSKPENMKECMMMGVEKGEMTMEELEKRLREMEQSRTQNIQTDGDMKSDMYPDDYKEPEFRDYDDGNYDDGEWKDESGMQDDSWRDENQYQERHREEYRKPEAEQWQDSNDASGVIDYDVSKDQLDQPVSSGDMPVAEDLLIERMPDQTLPQNDDSWKTYDNEIPEVVSDATSEQLTTDVTSVEVQNYVDTSVDTSTSVETTVDRSIDTTEASVEVPASVNTIDVENTVESDTQSLLDVLKKPFAGLISVFGF